MCYTAFLILGSYIHHSKHCKKQVIAERITTKDARQILCTVQRDAKGKERLMRDALWIPADCRLEKIPQPKWY